MRALIAGMVLACFAATGALAQQTPPPAEPRKVPSAPGGDLSQRMSWIEEQLVDLQVIVGTLESLVKARPDTVLPQERAHPQAPAGAGAPVDDMRVEALETQIRALTSQIEQLTQQMTALQARLDATPGSAAPPQAAPLPREGALPQGGEAEQDLALRQSQDSADDTDSASHSVTPAPEAAEPPLSLTEERMPWQQPTEEQIERKPADTLAALPEEDARSLYERGYANLLRQDYEAAKTAFTAVIEGHPADPVAQDAQFWLGETYYALGDYRKAADSFLKTYRGHEDGSKAPDSLLKLGMSLAKLGEKDSACATFTELMQRYPQAPQHVRDSVNAARKSAGC